MRRILYAVLFGVALALLPSQAHSGMDEGPPTVHDIWRETLKNPPKRVYKVEREDKAAMQYKTAQQRSNEKIAWILAGGVVVGFVFFGMIVRGVIVANR